ncbi:MAG: DUF3592 domain-containing protein [Planctomycetes bacterium]|nr:DUF3592 domain-containing protein [Planctomycetota bacterium]
MAEAEARYESRTEHAPLIGQGSRPRSVTRLGSVAASGGHFLSWFGGAWLGFSLMMLFPAVAFVRELGVFPIAFTGLFISIGALLMYFAIRRGLTAVRLVEVGELTWAVITRTDRKVSTSRDSDGRTSTSVSYDVLFMYRTTDGESCFGEINLQRPDAITDEDIELLIYDPTNPAQMEFADLLPGGLRIDSQGNTSESSRSNMLSLIPFALLMLGVLFGILMLRSLA